VPQGSLAFRVTPYADVFLDGKNLGLTPLEPVALYPGRHSVKLENAQLRKRLLRTVTIRPGRRTTLVADLTKEQ
jgi:eukaryotic-like serine/threonine-protein kinase